LEFRIWDLFRILDLELRISSAKHWQYGLALTQGFCRFTSGVAAGAPLAFLAKSERAVPLGTSRLCSHPYPYGRRPLAAALPRLPNGQAG